MKAISRPKRTSGFVICVGNNIVGGAGKTPVCLALGQELIARGFKVAYITRGYLGKLSSNTSIHVKTSHTAVEVGDEALLLEQVAPTYIGKNRYFSANLAIQHGAQILIMDDGLQNFRLYKDYKILVVGEFGFGNNLPIPAGPLRELTAPLLKEVSYVLQNPQHALYKSPLTSSKYLAFSGIADPTKFFQSLKNNEIDIVNEIAFPDHHQFSNSELNEIITAAMKLKAAPITTSKDYARIPEQYKPLIIEAKITTTIPVELVDEIVEKCNSAAISIVN